MFSAFILASANNTSAFDGTFRFSNDRSLPFSIRIALKVDDDPISRAAQAMGKRRVGVKCGEFPPSSFSVQNG
jgi:hypothetical protein